MYKAENKIGELSVEYSCDKFARIIYNDLKHWNKNWECLKFEINGKQIKVEFYKHDNSYENLLSAVVFETYIYHVWNTLHKFQTYNEDGGLTLLDWENVTAEEA